METALDKKYREHEVFGQINCYAEFYKDLSYHIMSWMSSGTDSIFNLDTYVYSSMQGTLESIHDSLAKGRIGDAYTLLRKYYDSTIINVYTNLYLEDHHSVENFVVEKINNWLKGSERLPEYRIMSQYISASAKLETMRLLITENSTHKDIRERCNDHTHYNYYHNIMINDNEIYLQNDRIEKLDHFTKDIEEILIQHLAYIFYLKGNYMMSSDYVDELDVGNKPDEELLHAVAPFIQDMLSKSMKTKKTAAYEELKNKSGMQLE